MAAATEAAVLGLFTQHNKPFGVQGMVDNLQSAGIKKAAVQKACDALCEAGKIVCKEFGKTKIYLPQQQGLAVLSKEELDARKAELKQLQEQLVAESKATREAEAELRSWNSSLTAAELDAQVAALTVRRDAQAARLAGLRGGARLVSREERAATERSLRSSLEVWRKRKAVFRAIWDTISEGLEGKQADLFEEMGVDSDEAAGVDYAQVADLLPKGGGGGAAGRAAGVKRPRG